VTKFVSSDNIVSSDDTRLVLDTGSGSRDGGCGGSSRVCSLVDMLVSASRNELLPHGYNQ
jgi:hypothetical protein